jgi:hypothetical protein
MEKKVLVICQRKKSYVYDIPNGWKTTDALAVDITVKKLEQYVYDYYKTRNVKIEYMIEYRNNKDEYEADYKIRFNPSSRKTNERIKSYEFIRNHINDYDMVMLQTCPLSMFVDNIKYLSWIMKPNGVLTIKAFGHFGKDKIDMNRIPPFVYDTIIRYFYHIDDDILAINNKED